MERDQIIEALKKYNFWAKEIDTGIPRQEYLRTMSKFVQTDKIISVVGPRRTGKSTLIKQMARELVNKFPKESTLIVNFEDPVFEGAVLADLTDIYEAYLEIIKPTTKPFLFLDEIQTIRNWERFVRSLNEQKEAYLVVSGSSSKLLSEELATVLAGRQFYFEVFPLSFNEFLYFRGLTVTNPKDIILNSQKIRPLFREYLEFGGYPEIVVKKDREFAVRTILSYYEDTLIKDVVRRFRVKEIEKLRSLARFYITNSSSLITFNSISKFVNLPVETVRRFTSYLETSKILFFIKRFSFKVKEQENSPRKVYAIDTGLPNVLGFRFSDTLGKSMENIVAIQLKRKQAENPLLEIYYWNNRLKEVDFVIKEKKKIKALIQVCWNVSDSLTKKREVDALIVASKEIGCCRLLVVTDNYEAVEKTRGKKIEFIPAWKWLLQNSA